jgi:hypothetical protein
MSLVVVEAAPSTMLTTLEKVKASLGITVTTKDEELTDLIQAASDFAVRYCGRSFALQKVREGLPGKGTNEILLSLTPIVAIDTVYYKEDLIDDTSYRISDAEVGSVQSDLGFRGSYYANRNSWNDFPSTDAKEVYYFTYDGGYVLPGWGTSHGTRTLPFDLERAIIGTVTAQYKTSLLSAGGTGQMTLYKIGDTEVRWNPLSAATGDGGASAFFPPGALAVLNWYRRSY